MADEWLSRKQAAQELCCSQELVCAMEEEGLLSTCEANGQVYIPSTLVNAYKEAKPKLPSSGAEAPHRLPVNPGMVEVSAALAGIAVAMLALWPDQFEALNRLAKAAWIGIACLALVLFAYSAISSFWLLAIFCCQDGPDSTLEKLKSLITESDRHGPYWLMAIGLVAWFLLVLLLGVALIVS